jgi:hypothetical protein
LEYSFISRCNYFLKRKKISGGRGDIISLKWRREGGAYFFNYAKEGVTKKVENKKE